jgi:hypothetical protein
MSNQVNQVECEEEAVTHRTSKSSRMPKAIVDFSELTNTERVVAIISQLMTTVGSAINEIRSINENTKLLALNARIESARFGEKGAAFGVVAKEMQGLSGRTALVASEMSTDTRQSIEQLMTLISGNVLGTRLADISLNCLDLIDRNLYERTCDVRWWATDASIVDALSKPSPQALAHASTRMGIILNAYTVYSDLVLVDKQGTIVANGRPDQFNSINRDESSSPWFRQSQHSRTGDEYGFQSAHESRLANGNPSLIYSCSVREMGQANGAFLGALGVVFNWNNFANAILSGLPLDDVEKQRTSVYIVERDGSIVACSKSTPMDYRFPVQRYPTLIRGEEKYVQETVEGKDYCVAHAKAPGFETYSTNWHAFLVQQT